MHNFSERYPQTSKQLSSEARIFAQPQEPPPDSICGVGTEAVGGLAGFREIFGFIELARFGTQTITKCQ